MNEELKDWTESLGKKASDYESCMICTKQIDSLKQENARLRDQVMALSKIALERGEWAQLDTFVDTKNDICCFPVKISWEIPDRKIEITESEFDKLMLKHYGVNEVTKLFKEQLFSKSEE